MTFADHDPTTAATAFYMDDLDEMEAIERAKREGIILRLPTGKFPGTDKPIE